MKDAIITAAVRDDPSHESNIYIDDELHRRGAAETLGFARASTAYLTTTSSSP